MQVANSKSTLRIATFAVPLSGNKGSASMLVGLLDGLRAEQISNPTLLGLLAQWT
jgi:hypothetical protein